MNTMTKIKLALIAIPILSIIACNNQEVDLSKPCIEGQIPNNIIYKTIYDDCYKNALWIEVLSDASLGENVKIFTPSPTSNPSPPIEYANVIEVPLPDIFQNNTQLDTLLGKKVYFQYRIASNEEMNSIRNDSCNEIYDTYKVPFLILTYFSLDGCPQSSEQ